MIRQCMCWCSVVLALCLLSGAAVGADSSEGTQIITSGSSEVLVPATQASFSVEVTNTASTAAAASAESARIERAVARALEGAGLGRKEVADTRLTVGPRWVWDEATKRERKTGYEATIGIKIETEQLERIGQFMDAALNAGATGVSDVRFSAKDTGDARRRALTEAVDQARGDAATVARAGGGTLGQIVLITTEPSRGPGVELEEIVVTGKRRDKEAVSTSIVPSQIRVTARVVVRWKFVPAATTQ